MNRKRLDEETYEQYKVNLKKEDVLIRIIKHGILIWNSGNGPYKKPVKTSEK